MTRKYTANEIEFDTFSDKFYKICAAKEKILPHRISFFFIGPNFSKAPHMRAFK